MKDIAISENHLYQKAFTRGRRQSGRYVTVYVLKDLAAKRLAKAHPQKKTVNRIGLSVPKREGGAIERNRVKRMIRAGLYPIEREAGLKTGYLIVIHPRPGISGLKSWHIEKDLRIIFGKLDMLTCPSPQHTADRTPGQQKDGMT